MKSVVLLLALFFLSGCSETPPSPPATKAPPGDVVAALHTYVAAQLGWALHEYQIEERRREGTIIVCEVVFLADLKSPRPRGGKSFEAHFDTAKRELVKTLGYQ